MALSRITQERTRLEPTRGGTEERGDGGPEEVAQVSICLVIFQVAQVAQVAQVSICLANFHTHVTILNLDQHSAQEITFGRFSHHYHQPINRNTNILSNSRTAH